jgi:hypothetical protein
MQIQSGRTVPLNAYKLPSFSAVYRVHRAVWPPPTLKQRSSSSTSTLPHPQPAQGTSSHRPRSQQFP